MAADASVSLNATAKHFSKRVPATSVSPTYKLTLPSEIVSAALSHLVEKEFKLVEHEEGKSWSVAILPRKNKDKFEYTLQGWRAFAEERCVKNGDILSFTLVSSDKLQVSITRRPALPAEQLLSQSFVETAPLRDASNTSSSEEKQILQLEGLQSLLGPSQLSSTASPHAHLLFNSERSLDILELGHDPRDEALSPQQSSRNKPGSYNAMQAAGKLDSDAFTCHNGRQTFRRSSESETEPVGSPEEQLWALQDASTESPQSTASKRQRLQMLMNSPVELRSAAMHNPPPVVTLPSRQPGSYPGAHPHHSHQLGATGYHPTIFSPSMRRPDNRYSAAEMSSAEVAELRQGLSRAIARGERAELEAASLTRGWRAVTVALDQHTSCGLTMTDRLFSLSERMETADLAPMLDAQAAQELGLLQSDLRHCANGLLETLWRIKHLYQQDDSTRCVRHHSSHT